MEQPKIAIIYLSFHCEPYIDMVVNALKNITYPKDRLELVIVDNPHPQHGSSVRYLEENVMPLSEKELPHVTILAQKENWGFAGGNNKGVEWALEHNFDYVYFHNNDGFVATDCFEPLVEAMEADKTIGIAQSLIVLYPDTDRINSAGNAFHYLGFGYCDKYRMKVNEVSLPAVKEVPYASGAGVMVSLDAIKKHGAWDGDFFMYHEDLEWSLRLRMQNYKIILVSGSVFYHQYQFSRSIMKFYWMERNRFAVLLMFFRIPTLLLLTPMLLVMEVGQWIYGIKNGAWTERIKVYKYWVHWKNWKIWLAKRKKIQKTRKVSDRYLMSFAATGIYFQDTPVDDPILKYIGNPIMKVYYWIVVKGLIWW